MAGITSYGLHFAAYRLPLSKIAAAWEGKAGKGEKAVASYDEDALTLACAAAQDVVGEHDPSKFGGLFFASTTSPYLEKSVSSFISHVHRLPKGAVTADFTNSRRCASSAFRAALDAVQAGSADNVIVAAGEARTAEPGSGLEQVMGDGGAALCVGKQGAIAEILASHAVTEEAYDEFRRAGEDFVNEGDQRFAQSYNFTPSVVAAVKGVLAKGNLKPEQIDLIAIAADNAKAAQGACQKAGLDPAKLVSAYLPEVGYLGAAQSLATLALALEKAGPGKKILWVSYGDGADAFIFQTTEAIKSLGGSRVEAAIADKRPMNTYEKYLKLRGVFKIETPGPEETPVLHWNEREWNLPLLSDRCEKCGLVYYPPQAVCLKCGDRSAKKRIPTPRRGKIFTFTKDFLVANPDPPQVTTVVTADNGARVFLQGADFEDSDVTIDAPVEFQIRKLHDGGEYPIYYWKCRPVRK
ncbi:MAG: 3-oxoacyl-[acyl-carrier-protein] synthase III C-terminal domain-containing protein [Bdellovibrionota bacterium]